jgi:predicted ATPase
VLRVVSVFADGFELEDVVAVAEAPALTPVAVTVGLGGLVAKSLMGAEANGAGLRYRLLDSTRRYALERLKADPVAPRVRRHHAERVLAIFERSEAEWVRHETGDWTARYRSRLPDLRAALCWAFGNDGDAALGLRLTAAAIPLWFETSLLAEGQAQVELALARAADIPCDDLLKTKLASFRAWAMSYARKLAPELEQVWRDAIGFAERAGSVQHQLQALVGLAFHLMDIGKVAASIDCLEAFESLSARHQDLSAGPEGARALALARAYTGALSESRNVLERLAATYSHPKRGSRMAGFQVDRYIGIRNYLSLVAWLNGSPDHAATKAGKAVDAAESLGHLASQSCVLALAAVPVAFLNGDARALARYTGKLRSILELESIGIWMPIERFFSGALDDMRGEPRAIGAMQDAIDAFIDCGIRSRIPLYLGILADALTRSGRLDEAGDTIAMAFQHQTQQGARWCRSELQRIEASLFRRAGRNAQAERLLHHALEEAQAIDALGFELRIATDLADLYVATQRGTDARHLLEPVYSKFREGFGRRDLIQAARLLQRADTAAA